MELSESIKSRVFDRFGLVYFSDPDLESAYQDNKFLETRFLVVLVGFAGAADVIVNWAWDWAIDPLNAGGMIWMRLAMGGILCIYPLLIIAGLKRKWIFWYYLAMLLTTEGYWLHKLSFLETGLVYGISGLMLWLIMPVFGGLIFPAATNALVLFCLVLLPNLLVPMGVSPDFELIKYNAIIWSTYAIMTFTVLLLDQLYRRIFLYRQKTEELAAKDGLTGIANRRHLMEVSDHLLKVCRRQKEPLSVIMIDIDYFKRINDDYGHLIGDTVIKHVAKILTKSLRKSDFAGRYGGEEFAVILPQTQPQKSLQVAEKIRQKLNDSPVDIYEGNYVHVTLSAGVSGVNSALEDVEIEKLLKEADAALYEAKRTGRNRVVLFDREFLAPHQDSNIIVN